MKKIKVGNTFALVDDEDFEWLNHFSWTLNKKGYAKANITMHRALMLAPKDKQVDHKDWNKLNNQKSNLRLCTNAQNQQHSARGKKNKLGFKGINKSRNLTNPYVARITVNKVRKIIGHYKTPYDAARAYNKAATRYFGEFAQLNDVASESPQGIM